MRLYLFLCILFLSCTHSKIVYLITVFRHGARYPTNDYYDGNQTKPFHGRLTGVGLRHQYLLGSYIQNDYIEKLKLLNQTLHPRQIDLNSMFDSQRCIESAYGHALGLFSFQAGEKIDSKINRKLLDPPFQTIFPENLQVQQDASDFSLLNGFQPIPVRNGSVYFPKCDNEIALFEKRLIEMVPKTAQLQVQYALFTQQMKTLFNLTLKQANVGVLADVFDTLYCDNYLGRPLPQKLTDHDYEKLNFISRYLATLFWEAGLSNIYISPFVSHMISNMQNLIKGKLGVKKLSIHSAHDSNVLPLMVFYNLTSSECLRRQFRNETVKSNCAVPIPFASNLFFELHQDDQELNSFYVKARYNGQYYHLCEKNSTECNFSQFSKRSKQNIMDFDKQCAKKETQKQLFEQ